MIIGSDLIRAQPNMDQIRPLVCLIQREDDAYVATCPVLDIASQGNTVESARQSLTEAIELFLETADPNEVGQPMCSEVYITSIEVKFG